MSRTRATSSAATTVFSRIAGLTGLSEGVVEKTMTGQWTKPRVGGRDCQQVIARAVSRMTRSGATFEY